MDRRAYLQAAGAAGLATAAGCLDGVLESSADGAVLGPPEQDLSESSHPTYGDEIPSFSVHDPFAEETITDDQFRGERALLMTFFFTSCPDNLCPALLQMLRHSREDAREEGYDDDVSFLAVTFDPEYDTPDVLEDEAENIGIDPYADNWHFLRPEDNDAAYELVAEDFGTPVHLEDHDHDDGHGEEDHHDDSHDDGHGHNETDHGDGHDQHDNEEEERTDGTHVYIILLVNENGIVERAYPGATQHSVDDIIDDLQAVVEG